MGFDFSALVTGRDAVRSLRSGEPVFQMGEQGTSMYVVTSGEIGIQVGGLQFETVGRGGVVGEMALIDEQSDVRSASAVALGDCSVAEIDRARFLDMVRTSPQLAIELCKVSIRRLRATTYLTHHDSVTGLPNRHRFLELCATALLRAQRRGSAVGVMYVDLDHFKGVNESLGYAAGDQLLRGIGGRLRGAMHELDVVARLGADEFAVLLEDLASVDLLTSKAEEMLHAVAKPLRVAGQDLFASASIGISCYPQDGDDADALIKSADSAMRLAKDGGRNAYRYYSRDMHVLAVEAQNLKNHLRVALERDEFHLHYQPRVQVEGGGICGLEALLRWRHPELGSISPGKFIPIAEQSGLIDEIGDWVLRTGCAQMKRWIDAGVAPQRLAVNLSMRQLRRPDLTARVEAILRETGLDPNRLELEVTESAVMDDPARTVFMLKELRALGIAVALDDFGTAYSSLGYLKQFPLDYMKIDQSFMRGIPEAQDDIAIALTIVSLAKNLRLRVIAEGVERKEQLAFLERSGCEEYQGYLFAKPLPPPELEPLLREHPMR